MLTRVRVQNVWQDPAEKGENTAAANTPQGPQLLANGTAEESDCRLSVQRKQLFALVFDPRQGMTEGTNAEPS